MSIALIESPAVNARLAGEIKARSRADEIVTPYQRR